MSSVSTGCVAQMFSVSSVLQACCGNHREGQQWPSVCMPVAKPQELSVHLSLLACSRNHRNPLVHLSLLACYTYRNHWNHLFTSVCWPVPEITGTLCSPQFAGLLQKPRGALFSSVCRPVAEETGTICSPLFAGLLLKPLGPLFTSVCWPVTEATGPSVHLCLLACCRSHRALCSPLFAGLLQKPQGRAAAASS